MKRIRILIPVYNDWLSVYKLLENINEKVSTLNAEFSITIVNDASTESRPEFLINLENLIKVEVLNMRENRGHARCNAAGLKYLDNKNDCDYVIPMDGDGEDRPEEIILFFKKLCQNPDKVITANRVKRSEPLFFKFCYLVHKGLTFVFTGQSIKYGNYTCLPKKIVHQMVNESSTWNSFSGSLSKISTNKVSIPSKRGSRYFGPSKMSFFSLLKHSISIIAVFKKILLFRSLLFLIVYQFLIIKNISFITLIPVVGVIGMMISVIMISKRENYKELNNSLENIGSIDIIK